MIDADLILSMLEQPCTACDGAGSHVVNQFAPRVMHCEPCNGTGKALTDLGHEVIDFIGRHLFPEKWQR